ncbi:MAG: DUF2914 domain-containing protein [Planctomycetes bacterium]|nr:DUF2914 domain-containing protein [Planctomycetota bacterium]
MNQRLVVGLLIAGGLGIGLFAAVERVMRSAGRQVTHMEEPVREAESPLELVSAPAKKPEGPGMKPIPVPPVNPPPAVIPSGALPSAPKVPTLPLIKGAPVVEKLTVCLGVKDRNPIGETASVPANANRVYCWLRVSGGTGKKVRPVWTLNGKSYPGSWMSIGTNSFRSWTTKHIDASNVGAAKLEIQDDKGRVLAQQDFAVTAK